MNQSSNIRYRRIGFCFLPLLLVMLAPRPASAALSPQYFTLPAQPIRATNATLHGFVVPRTNVATAWFEWGLDSSYGNTTVPMILNPTNKPIYLSSSLTNLQTGAVYHYRLVVTNEVGIFFGMERMFTTGKGIVNWGSYLVGSPTFSAELRGTLTNITSVACAHGHGLALRNDGTPIGWPVSYNYLSRTVIPPVGLTNVIAVAGGYSHSLAIKQDGTVVTWGGYSGYDWSVPVPASATNVVAVGGGDSYSVALKNDGSLITWGRSQSGSGLPFTNNIPPQSSPFLIVISNIVSIACGSSAFVALRADGKIFNVDPENKFGSGSQLNTASNFVDIAFMALWWSALKADGTMIDNLAGWSFNDTPKPGGLSNVIAMATGYGDIEVITRDGGIAGWGWSQQITNIPARLTNLVAIAAGDYHCVGLGGVNLPPTFSKREYSGPVGTPFLVTLTASDPNGDQPQYLLQTLPGRGKLFQYLDGGFGAVIEQTNTILTDLAGRIWFEPEGISFGKPYANFTVVARDVEFESPPATVTLSIIPSPQLEVVSNDYPRSITLGFYGLTNGSYTLTYNPNSDWKNIWYYPNITATQVFSGRFIVVDNTVSNSGFRMYRLNAR